MMRVFLHVYCIRKGKEHVPKIGKVSSHIIFCFSFLLIWQESS